MLAQELDIARELGFGRVLCVCDEDNLASERVIIKTAENSVDKICAYCIRHQQANRNIANHYNTLVQNKNPTTKNCGRILAL